LLTRFVERFLLPATKYLAIVICSMTNTLKRATHFDHQNLAIAKLALAYPEHEQFQHLQDWARRVINRLEPQILLNLEAAAA